MKKFFLVAVMALIGLLASAQTMQKPIPIKLGSDNSYTLNSDEDQVTYYKYTASSQQDELVTLTMDITMLYVSVYEFDGGVLGDWVPDYRSYGHPTSTIYKFVAYKGQELLLAFGCDLVGNEQDGDVKNFTVTTEKYDPYLALTCENPLQLSDKPQYIPLGFEGGSDDMTPNYATYTPKSDCWLDIQTDYIPWEIYVSNSCDGEWTLVQEDVLSGRPHSWRMQAKKDQTYYFRITGSMASLIWVYEKQYTQGQDPELPFTGYVGQNRLPAEAGTYYYKLQAPSVDGNSPDNFIEIFGDMDLPGGYVSCAADIYGFNEVYNFGTLRLRYQVLPMQYCIIKVVKKESTEKDQVFNVRFTTPQPYDGFYTSGNVLTGMEQTTPEFPGTYYYRIIAPEQKGMIIKVTTDYEPKSTGFKMGLYRANLGVNNVLIEGTDEIRLVNIDPGMNYILKITTMNEDYSVPFTVDVYEAPQGDTSYWPLDAVAGDNQAPAGPQKFFRYTAQSDGWMYIHTDGKITEPIATYERADGYNARLLVYPESASVYRMRVVKDSRVTFNFRNVPEGASFKISETPLREGDTLDQAIPVTGSFKTNSLPGDYWYVYDADEPTSLTFSTDMPVVFGQNSLEGARATYYVYINDAEHYFIPDWNAETRKHSPMTVTANKGDKVYIETIIVEPDKGYSINFTTKEAKPGETSGNPIRIENQGNPTYWDLPAVNWNLNGQWYVMNLHEGVLMMEANDSFTLYVYDPKDLDNHLGRTGYLDYDEDTDEFLYGMQEDHEFSPHAEIPADGDYLFKVTSAERLKVKIYGPALTSVKGVTASEAGIFGGKGMITVIADNAKAEVYTTDGAHVASKSVDGTANISVAPGLYIVRVDGKSAKVVVK